MPVEDAWLLNFTRGGRYGRKPAQFVPLSLACASVPNLFDDFIKRQELPMSKQCCDGSQQDVKEKDMNHDGRTTAAPWIVGIVGMVGMLAGFGGLVGCSPSTLSATGGLQPSSTAAPMVVTVSDAPLSNILSAKVTLSALSLSGASTSTASVLSQPTKVELSNLGAVQEPIELTNLAFGTYNSVTLTVSAAQVTYTDSTGTVTTANATLGQPTITVALNPALTVTDMSELHLQMAFNLAQSFSIVGNVVTFTPAVNTAGGKVSDESSSDRNFEISGKVASVSSNLLTVVEGDSGLSFPIAINGSTTFSKGMTLSSIQAGAIVQVKGQTQTDGSLLAQTITVETTGDSGGAGQDGAKGLIVKVAEDGTGAVTGFTMVAQEGFGSEAQSTSVNVALTGSTSYTVAEDYAAAGAGLPTFSNAEVFPGQSVMVGGTADSTGLLTAAQVTLGGESVAGALAGAPQGSASSYTFSIQLPGSSYLTAYQGAASLNVVTNASTEFEDGLSSSMFAGLAATTNVEVHGYLLRSASGGLTFYATGISQVKAPEADSSGN